MIEIHDERRGRPGWKKRTGRRKRKVRCAREPGRVLVAAIFIALVFGPGFLGAPVSPPGGLRGQLKGLSGGSPPGSDGGAARGLTALDPVAAASEVAEYNRSGARGYAYKWWNDRNSHYYDFSGSGGDCANFVSQCLIAGGLSLHNGTDGTGYGVYPDEDRTSTLSYGTIPYCDYLNLHLRNHQPTNVTYVTDGAAYVPDEVTVGDVVIFGDKTGDHYKHAMLVVTDSGSDVGLAGHSSNVWDRSFFTELSYFSCATFYHLNDTPAEYHHFRIDTGALNVRVGPGKNNLSQNYQDIGDLHDGEEYVAFGKEFDENGKLWWHFWFDDRPAWCAAWYTINVTGNVPFEVNVGNYLNVRDGPGTGYSTYTQVYSGMRFVAQSIDGSWYKFWVGGTQKYCHSGYTDEVSLPRTNLTSVVMGFMPYLATRSVNYSTISHLAWFSVEVNSDGTIGSKHGWPEWDVINQTHQNGSKVVLTATMFSSSDIHTLLASASYRTAAVNNLLAEVRAGNADGVCIDFENPEQSGDGALLVQFIQELNDTFKTARPDYHVSLCTPPKDWWGTYDYYNLAPHLDGFMLMAYGYAGSWSSNAGPIAPLEGGSLNINSSVHDILEDGSGVTPEKVILGLPFYGYDFQVTGTSEKAPTRDSGSSRTYSAVMDLIATYSPTVHYDATSETAWFNYVKAGDGDRQVWFDNATSFDAKCQYALDENLSGIGIWASGYQGALGVHPELDQVVWNRFRADRAPPEVTIKLPVNGSAVNSTAVEVRWSGFDDVGLSGYHFSYDGGPWEDVGLQTSTSLVLLDGTHNVSVRATDTSSQTTEATHEFLVDTVAPAPVEGLVASPASWTSTDDFSISWTNPADTSGVVGAYYALDAPPTSDDGGTYAVGLGVSDVAGLKVGSDGVHAVYVWLRDAAGNVDMGYYRTTSLRLDTVAPSLEVTSPGNGTAVSGTGLLVTWDATDATSGVASVTLRLNGTALPANGTGYCELEDLAPGNYTLEVTASDLAGLSTTRAVQFSVEPGEGTGGAPGGAGEWWTVAAYLLVGLLGAAAGAGISSGLRKRGAKEPRQYYPELPPER
ncbi:MAG: glycosyl hydrolase family 18 protein [Promethearchaeota archaeon]